MGTNEKNMTTGSPGKLIITFAIPLMLGNIFQQFYTMADTMIVGQVALATPDWRLCRTVIFNRRAFPYCFPCVISSHQCLRTLIRENTRAKKLYKIV